MYWYHVHFRFRAEISRLQRIVELKTKEMNRVKRLAKTILDQVRWFAHVQLLNLLIILYLKRGLSSAASLNLILIFFFSFVANGSRTVFLGLTGIRQKWNYQKQVLGWGNMLMEMLWPLWLLRKLHQHFENYLNRTVNSLCFPLLNIWK